MITENSLTYIVKRNGTPVPYDRDHITTAIFNAAAAVGGSNRVLADDLAAEVEKITIDTYLPNDLPTVEDIQDIVEEVLIEHGHTKTARAYIIYRHERACQRKGKEPAVLEAVDNVPYKKIYDVLRWNIENGCDTLARLNQVILEGGFNDLVQACNDRYVDEVHAGAELMLERLPELRVIIIAGPSSSGKTTTTIKASESLARAGIQFKALTVDHYFYDLQLHPKDEFGDYDYETPQALDLDLINEHLVKLMNGETIKTPNYDFKTGIRTLNVHTLSLAKDEILLIDSLHGLYEPMTRGVPAANKFKLYIETLGQVRNEHGQFMRWADNRLMRRMVRDSWHRQLQPAQTLTHWHYVRRSELQNIIPYIGSVDYIVNSALPIELPIFKHRVFDFFPEAMSRYQDEPKRQDAYIRAKRIHDFLLPLTEIADDSAVPHDCLLREFIGGSTYEY
jgi:uridine kinase